MAIRPIITLTSDFGLTDFYVAAMKGVLLGHCPNATLIDITHQVFRQHVTSGSFTLERAIASFPKQTIHLAVVDPGVGSDRRLLIVQINGSTLICPDNGLVTWAWRRFPGAIARELVWRPATSSNTFHGRDIMAPVAGMIAAGCDPDEVAGPPIQPILLDVHPAIGGAGQVIHIDHFGNAITNIPAQILDSKKRRVLLRDDIKLPIGRTYSDVEIGSGIALVGSSELLEIAIRNGSATNTFNIHIGDTVALH